jgi:hypothetical protein
MRRDHDAICIVNRFGAPALTGFAADVASGAVTGSGNLSADLYRTSLTRACPRCSAAAIGDTGGDRLAPLTR